MAIYFECANLFLLQVPKTGSRWLEHAAQCCDAKAEIIVDDGVNGHGDLSVYKRHGARFACFIRHPVEWYRSYWAYRVAKNWFPTFPLDELCRSSDFSTFVERRLRFAPGGVSLMYEGYAGPRCAPIDYVGKFENLAEDFINLLINFQIDFDRHQLLNVPKANVGPPKPDWAPDLRQRVEESERLAISRFSY